MVLESSLISSELQQQNTLVQLYPVSLDAPDHRFNAKGQLVILCISAGQGQTQILKMISEIVLFNSFLLNEMSFFDNKELYLQAIYSHKLFKVFPQNTELGLNPTVVDFNGIPFVMWSKFSQYETRCNFVGF